MTIAYLLRNTLLAACRRRGLPAPSRELRLLISPQYGTNASWRVRLAVSVGRPGSMLSGVATSGGTIRANVTSCS